MCHYDVLRLKNMGIFVKTRLISHSHWMTNHVRGMILMHNT